MKPQILMALSLILSAQPAIAETDDFRALIQARSMDQLTMTLEKAKRLRHARFVCEAQLRTKRIPISCFEVIELEEPGQRVDSDREQVRLEALCLERVKTVRDQAHLKLAASRPFVPKACREAAKREADDLEYADGSAHRAEQFLRRLKQNWRAN